MGNFFTESHKKAGLVVAAGIGVLLGFQYLLPLLTPFIFAFSIVYLCNERLNRIQRKTHIRKEIFLAGVLILAAALVLALFWGIVQGGVSVAADIGNGWNSIRGQLQEFFGSCCLYVQEHFGVDAGRIERVILEKADLMVQELQAEIVPKLMKESWWYATKIISFAAFFGVFFVASILLCKDYDTMLNKMSNSEKGAGSVDAALGAVRSVIRLAAVYVKAQILILGAIMVVCSTGLLLGRIENGFLLGIAAGILDALPFIGTGIILLPTALFQLINGRVGAAVWCIGLYILCIGVREFLEPKLMGEKTGIYPVLMLFSVYAGVKIYGLAGIVKGPLAIVILMELWKRIMNHRFTTHPSAETTE